MHPEPIDAFETILVVDDETAMLRLATLMLERDAYRVLTATSGEEAIHLLQTWPDLEVDLMLVDIVMPYMTGLDLADRVREIRPGVPILFCSAYSEEEILRPVIARGVPYIAKPFTLLQLTQKIRELLDKGKAAGATGNSK